MNEVTNKTKVEDLIYEIKGKHVMLDSDLAKLYQCKMLRNKLIKQLKK